MAITIGLLKILMDDTIGVLTMLLGNTTGVRDQAHIMSATKGGRGAWKIITILKRGQGRIC